MLDFKAFLEMAHLIPRVNGQLNPLYINGKFVIGIDFKFETYPDQQLKKKLLMLHSTFSGKLKNGKYIVFNGNELNLSDHPLQNSIELPEDWYDRALLEFIDGKIKEPKN